MILPIDSLIPQILAAWPGLTNFLVSASPGSGKTTRLPAALLKVIPPDGQIWVLVPRRMAALLAARRVAEENQWELGGEVGYHFRFEHRASARTRLLFLTEGIFLRRLQSDPQLKGVACLILDEFHERHLETDLAVGLARALQKGLRGDLKIGVMSATIDPKPLKDFLPPLTDFDLQAPPHPLKIEYVDPEPALEESVKKGLLLALKRAEYSGHILTFLPGIGAIEKCRQTLSRIINPQAAEIIPLHGEMSPGEQTAFLKPSSKRKIILATNIAESSVTLDGVNIVIDSGWHRRASYSWWSGIPSLVTRPISKASAIQRAGRANRQGPGLALRLYPEHDFRTRPDYEVPEIKRADLTDPVLQLIAEGAWPFEWFESPPATALEHALKTLDHLGACHKNGRALILTPVGRQLNESSLNPRLARVMWEARQKKVESSVAVYATHLALKSYETGNLLDAKPARHNSLWVRQLEQLNIRKGEDAPVSDAVRMGEIASCLLAGFPDFVGQVKKQRSLKPSGPSNRELEVLLCQGGRVLLQGDQALEDGEFILVLDVQETKQGTHQKVHVKSYIPLSEDLVLARKDWLKDQSELVWNSKLQRVEEVYRVCYGQITLEEDQSKAKPCQSAAVLLFKEGFGIDLTEAGSDWPQARFLAQKMDEALGGSGMQELLARLYWLGRMDFAQDVNHAFALALRSLAGECVSLSELKEKSESFAYYLPQEVQRLLNTHMPVSMALPGRPKTPIHYDMEKPPWIESRMQDFFGLKQTPAIASGRLVLTCHLLAPNYRAVQVTQDLAGFWSKVYPELKGQLQRRYPRHKWI